MSAFDGYSPFAPLGGIDVEASLAEVFALVNPEYVEPEPHAVPTLASIIDEELQAAQPAATQALATESIPSNYDTLGRAPTSPRAQPGLSPPRSPPARSPFAYLSSPPQQRTPPASVQRDYPSPHTFHPAPTGAPEPNFPQYPFGPPYSTAPRPSRGSKRGRGSDSGLRFQGRTSKRPRLAGNPHVGVASNITPSAPVASSSRSAIGPPPRAVASNKENPHTLPAGPPPPSWGVVPSARENRTTHGVAKVRVPYAPSTLNPPLSSTPSAGPSSSVQKSTSDPVPTLPVPSLDRARYPIGREAQDLSREIHKDIQPLGAELVPQCLPPATCPASPPQASATTNKGKSKRAPSKTEKKPKTKRERKKKEPKARKRDAKKTPQSNKREIYFCPFYIPPHAHAAHKRYFRVSKDRTPAATSSSSPPLISCIDGSKSYARASDALRHALWAHVQPRPYCIYHKDEPFNRPDGIKRHLKSGSCLGVSAYEVRVRQVAAGPGGHGGLSLEPHSKSPQALRRHRLQCEKKVALAHTRIGMPCYQDPKVQYALGTYLFWRRLSLEDVEREIGRRSSEEVERCACAPCQEKKQAWADEWRCGEKDVPPWYGRLGDDMEGVDWKDEAAANQELEVKQEGHKDDTAVKPKGRLRPQLPEDDDRLSPEPEEGVDEDEVAMIPVAPAPVGSSAGPPGPSFRTIPPRAGKASTRPDNMPPATSRTVPRSTTVLMESPMEQWRRTFVDSSASSVITSAPPLDVALSPMLTPYEADDGVDWKGLMAEMEGPTRPSQV